DLAHYIRSGQLARSLLRSAPDPVTRAFARGWATHVLADALIHPLINRAAGELLGRGEPLTFADDPVGHIRVEQALDGVVAARFGYPALPTAGCTAAFGSVVSALETGFRQTYGFAPPISRVAASFRALVRGVPMLLGYGRFAAWWLGEPT